MLTHEAAVEAEEYRRGKVEYLRTSSEIATEEGQVSQRRIDSTDHAVVVKEGRTVRVPMSRVVRIRLEH